MALREAGDLIGARVSKVYQVGDLIFIIRLFSPKGALLIDPLEKAFHRTELRPPTPEAPPAFAALLRKHIRGRPLLGMEQYGFDRLIRLLFPEVELWIDFRPRAGKVLLMGEGKVIGSLGGGDPEDVEWRREPDPLEGVGPGIKKSLAVKLGREPEEDELREYACELLEFDPKGYLYRTRKGLLASFFPREDLGEPLEVFPRFFQALDRVREESLAFTEARGLIRAVKDAIRRKERAIERIQEQLSEARKWKELKEKADLILTRLNDIPRGASEAVVEGLDGVPVRISLDPLLPPQEYAQRLYTRAKKLRRAAEELPRRVGKLEGEIRELRELLAELERRPYLAPYLEAELEELGVAVRREESGEKRERPRPREFAISGFRVLVGRSARENEKLVREAHPRDLWLHARGVPGAHVIVKSAGRDVPEDVLKEAARLAAWHSKARYDTKVAVTYTEVRHLRKPRGAPPGAFAVLKENVIVVRPGGEDGSDD